MYLVIIWWFDVFYDQTISCRCLFSVSYFFPFQFYWHWHISNVFFFTLQTNLLNQFTRKWHNMLFQSNEWCHISTNAFVFINWLKLDHIIENQSNRFQCMNIEICFKHFIHYKYFDFSYLCVFLLFQTH